MKSEKGITLTSLVIYVIGITIIFAVVANLTIYFNKNSRTIEYTTNNSAQITRLNQYLINDTKKENAQITEANENIIIIQADGETIKYTFVTFLVVIQREVIYITMKRSGVTFLSIENL